MLVLALRSRPEPVGQHAQAKGSNTAPARPPQPVEANRQEERGLTSEQGMKIITGVVVWIILAALAILYLVSVILMLAWVARDARCRNVDGGAVWVIVILFTHWVGLLVYLASRPHGMLKVCDTCANKRLVYSKTCPHCGNA